MPSLSYGPANPLPGPGPGSTSIAARWSGYIGPAQDGNYNLSFVVDSGATVEVVLGGQPVTMTQSGTTWSNQSAISLQAGALTPVQITATGLQSTFSASWESLGTGWQPIPPANLYSDILVGYMRTTFLRFLKATSLASRPLLSAAEMAYLATLRQPHGRRATRGWPVSRSTPRRHPAPLHRRHKCPRRAARLLHLEVHLPAAQQPNPQLLQALQDIVASPARPARPSCLP